VAIYPHLLTQARNSGKTPEQFFKILLGLNFTEELFNGNLRGGGEPESSSPESCIVNHNLMEVLNVMRRDAPLPDDSQLASLIRRDQLLRTTGWVVNMIVPDLPRNPETS